MFPVNIDSLRHFSRKYIPINAGTMGGHKNSTVPLSGHNNTTPIKKTPPITVRRLIDQRLKTACILCPKDNNNSVTYNEATGQYEITVGIGGGLKFTATPKKADNNNSDPKPDDKPKEETTARKENADTSATAANNNALISLDYKNHILTIDMTTTPAQIFLTDTICRFQRNGFETVVIKVANGSFTVAMDDLVQMIGTAFSFTLKVAGDTLSISAGGNEIATLVMA